MTARTLMYSVPWDCASYSWHQLLHSNWRQTALWCIQSHGTVHHTANINCCTVTDDSPHSDVLSPMVLRIIQLKSTAEQQLVTTSTLQYSVPWGCAPYSRHQLLQRNWWQPARICSTWSLGAAHHTADIKWCTVTDDSQQYLFPQHKKLCSYSAATEILCHGTSRFIAMLIRQTEALASSQ